MKPLKNLALRLKIWTARRLFKVFYGTYYYPFETADDAYLRLPKPEQFQYLADVSRFIATPAYKAEMKELVRKFYADLATKANDEVLITAYRLNLLMISDLQKRWKNFDTKYKSVTK